ncbi:MAG TPA: glycosyltransferase 87 family protein [Thermoleophilaceae bacterium]
MSSAAPALPARSAPALSQPLRRSIGLAGLAGLLLFGALIAVGGAGGRTFEVPASAKGLPGWIAGPFEPLGVTLTAGQFLLAVLAMCACYAAVLVAGDAVRARWAIGAVVLLHALFTLAPPLLSKDIFSYLEYARLGVVHDVNPYDHVVRAVRSDDVYRYLGWRSIPSAYGPLFTVATYPLATVSAGVGLWTVKVVTGLASLGCVALVWDCARRLGRSPVPAIALFGLNPVLLVWGVGGAHNDILMLFLALAGVALMLRARAGLGTAAVVAGTAIKASVGVLLPFMVLAARDRRRALAGIVAGGTAMLLIAVAAFQGQALGVIRVLRTQQQLVSDDAIPTQLARAVGLPGVTSDVRFLARLLLIAAIAWLLWLVWRRGYDWIAASGWALIAFTVASSWLLGWYVLWPLPFAAIADDRRLKVASLALVAYFVAMRWPILGLGEG